MKPEMPKTMSGAFLTIRKLKDTRRKATPEQYDEIDAKIRKLEPNLSHEEAVYLVQMYETEWVQDGIVTTYAENPAPWGPVSR